MVGHLFKLIWNKRKRNILLLTEMLISFLVLFVVFTLIVYYYRNYYRPTGFDYEDVWVINFNTPPAYQGADSLLAFYAAMRRELKLQPGVRAVSFTNSGFPFSRFSNTVGGVEQYLVGDGYKDVFHFQMEAGRWFVPEDTVARDQPVILTAALKEKLFGNGDALGKTIDMGHRLTVIGVIADIKAKGDYMRPVVGDFTLLDSGGYRGLGMVLVRMAPGATPVEEGRLYKTMTRLLQN